MSANSSPTPKVQDLLARIQRMEDKEAIAHLLVVHAQGSDKQNDPDILVPLFTKDAVFDVGRRPALARSCAVSSGPKLSARRWETFRR
jgi:hypothetical protein